MAQEEMENEVSSSSSEHNSGWANAGSLTRAEASRRRYEGLHAGWVARVAVPASSKRSCRWSDAGWSTREAVPARRNWRRGSVLTRGGARGWSPFSPTRVTEGFCSRSHAGEAAQGSLPARMNWWRFDELTRGSWRGCTRRNPTRVETFT